MLHSLKLPGVLTVLLLVPALVGCGGGGGSGGSDPVDLSQGAWNGGDLPQPDTPPPGDETPAKLTFRELETATGTGLLTAQFRVARNQTEYLVLWNELQSWWQPGMGAPIQSPPIVDFTTEIVVAIFLGPRPTAGYSVVVVDVEEDGNGARVAWEERQPGANCVTAQVVTYPYTFIAMERVEGAIASDGSVIVIDCP